jgi:rsbT co-antagonist protein RsbR
LLPETKVDSLIQDMGLDGPEVISRLRAARVYDEDVARLRKVGGVIDAFSGEATDEFIRYLRAAPEIEALLNAPVVDRIRALKQAHIREMGRGEYGENYVRQRIELALLYSGMDLPMRWFLGAFHHLIRLVGQHLLAALGRDSDEGLETFMSLNKLAVFDASLMADVLVFQRERTIRAQEEAIRELSTPVLRIRERLLILPVIGVVDTERARLLTDGLLQGIRENRAKVVIMDVTGVPDVDSSVANHLVQAVEASRLMGATVIMTGLAPEIAHTLVTLGVDLRSVYTVGDLQGGLEEGERLLGYVVKRKRPTPRVEGRDPRS